MTATKYVKEEILTELRKGNTEVLKELPPYVSMSLGMAIQREAGDVKEESPINDKDLNEAMLERLKDSGIKEMLIKKIEQEEKERAEKVAHW